MSLTAETWPITAALLQFPSIRRDGSSVQDADPDTWAGIFREVADSGFSAVDLTDSCIRPGDLSPSRLIDLASAAADAGVALPVVSVARRSVIDPEAGNDNLAYGHRTIDAAAGLGMSVVCVGLHRPLTPEQRRARWFWTVDGPRDPVDDTTIWALAVHRLRELGAHARDAGLLLSLELYEDTYLGTGDSAARLVEDIGLSEVGLNPDIGNLIRAHHPIEDWYSVLEKTLPYTNYWHVKSYQRDEAPERDHYVTLPVPMENGIINYREAFALAVANGFQGIICAESYGGDGLSVSATNQAYLRRHVLPKQDGYPLGRSRVLQRVTPAPPERPHVASPVA